MALFTDGPISSIEDLTAQDSQLSAVAGTEGIDVTAKLALAQDEIGQELEAMLARLVPAGLGAGAAVWPSPPGLGSLVVTPPLKAWHTFRALEIMYADAYNNQLNDRYAGKRDQFRDRAERARERLIEMGVGVASDPVPQAATPEVTPTTGAALPAGTYYVSTAWVNGRGEEGAISTPAVATVAGGTLAVRAGDPPGTATGWNVYAGDGPDTMTLQNTGPIGTGQSWVQPAPLAAGHKPGTGQAPSYLKPLPRVIERG
jgi:hypothetical protein